jgi:large subunit ribosomal protein L1
MAKKRSKRYRNALKLVTPLKAYSLQEAVATLKNMPAAKFDQSVTISFRLGVDPRQSDQMVRGTCALPHGSGKEVRVAVFAEGEAATAALQAGAEFVGMADLIKRVRDEGFTAFDVCVATPAAMAEVRKLGKVLGPRGLMPNPKTGTVTDDTARAIREVKAGRVDFKVDRSGNVSVAVGKISFGESQLMENTGAVIDAVQNAKPASAKGIYMLNVTLAATMTPGLRVDTSALAKA